MPGCLLCYCAAPLQLALPVVRLLCLVRLCGAALLHENTFTTVEGPRIPLPFKRNGSSNGGGSGRGSGLAQE